MISFILCLISTKLVNTTVVGFNKWQTTRPSMDHKNIKGGICNISSEWLPFTGCNSNVIQMFSYSNTAGAMLLVPEEIRVVNHNDINTHLTTLLLGFTTKLCAHVVNTCVCNAAKWTEGRWRAPKTDCSVFPLEDKSKASSAFHLHLLPADPWPRGGHGLSCLLMAWGPRKPASPRP